MVLCAPVRSQILQQGVQQVVHNSIKAGIIGKLCYLMESVDSNFVDTALSRGLICAGSKLLQIPTISMLPPGSFA